MTYVDSSCLVKVFRREPGSDEVVAAISKEPMVVVSALTELETLIQLKGFHLAGEFTLPRWRLLETRLEILRNQPPYVFRPLRASIFQTALRQHRNSGEHHCRTVDRLHLAAMEELEVSRLMTHDDRQARAAQAAGFSVVMPGRD